MNNYVEYDISYDFYKEYADSSLQFTEKLDERIVKFKLGGKLQQLVVLCYFM